MTLMTLTARLLVQMVTSVEHFLVEKPAVIKIWQDLLILIRILLCSCLGIVPLKAVKKNEHDLLYTVHVTYFICIRIWLGRQPKYIILFYIWTFVGVFPLLYFHNEHNNWSFISFFLFFSLFNFKGTYKWKSCMATSSIIKLILLVNTAKKSVVQKFLKFMEA